MSFDNLPLRIRFRLWDRPWIGNKTWRAFKESNSKVRYIGNKKLLKMACHPTEYEAMEFVRQNTTIPIPRVYGVYPSENGNQDLVMEKVPGDDLNVLWTTLTSEEKTNVAVELAGYISQLRALKPSKEGFVGSLGMGPCFDTRLGVRRFGPFESIADFHKFVRRGDDMDLWAFSKDVTEVHKRSSSYVTKFTHADISPENIFVKNGKITAIIDWETAGWFPEYWEYTKLYIGFRPYREDFFEEMDKVLTIYPQELDAEKPLMLEYDIWSYDFERPRRSVDEGKWMEWDVLRRAGINKSGTRGRVADASVKTSADVASS